MSRATSEKTETLAMTRSVQILGILLLVLMAGCGGPSADNSAIQTPDDQPIGSPGKLKARDGSQSPLQPTTHSAAPLAGKEKNKSKNTP